MYELPKLRIEISHCEHIRYLDKVLFWGDNVFIVEGRIIQSYEELAKLATEEPYKTRGYLEAKLESLIGGG